AYAKGMINNARKVFGTDVADMVKGIIIKDYPIGISKVTINKVFGKGFIFKFDVRKGSKFEGKLKPNVQYAQSTKLDGVRSVVLVNDKGVQIFGRSGKTIDDLKEIEALFNKYYEQTNTPMMFDGELLAIDETESIPNDELFRITSKILRVKGDKSDIKFVMFDNMPLEEFYEGKSKLKFKERRDNLLAFYEQLKVIDPKVIDIVPIHYIGNDMAEIQSVQKKLEDSGFEGSMLDEIDAYYEAKRTKSLLKFKTFHTVDLRCLRVEEHVRGNKVGNIVVDYKGYELGVGSGFSDKDRKLFWEQKDLIEGKIVEISYFEESKNDKGGESLRFPVFKMVRNDKDEVSLN
ncbi:TPA: ATP-dependent DNA ligase, partial [Staphylococcus aureus]|nr:ATP-dependent DNA ligase [Staphylococcus aureus]